MNTQERIRVMLVDDHAMVRRGLASFLMAYDDLEMVGEASSGEEAIALCQEVEPDVVLMDLVLGDPAGSSGMDGTATTRAIRQLRPQVQVIALTSFKEEDLVQKALQAGAIGFLFKNVSADELAAAIRMARAGRPTLAVEATQVLIRATIHPAQPGSDLTEREREVLALMAEGLSNAEIARRLVVSPTTVKSHVSNVLAKLGATSRTEAVVLALQKRIVRGRG
jgi:two-component system, NarL family, response regulator LiaR